MSPSGAYSGSGWWTIHAAILLLISFALTSCGSVASALSPTPTPVGDIKIIEILLFDTTGKPILKGAEIHVGGGDGYPQTDDQDDGGYYVQSCVTNQYIVVRLPGYRTAWVDCETGQSRYPVTLHELARNNNLTYSWNSAESCRGCHSDLSTHNEYEEWRKDGHSTVFEDTHFWTMYMGMDRYRNRSELTEWDITASGHKMRVKNESTFGPGYLLDYPIDQGNCAYCHAPALIQGGLQTTSLENVINNFGGTSNHAITEGVSCDVCHKVVGALMGEGQLPYSDRPGVLSLSYMLPDPGDSFMIGPSGGLHPSNHDQSCAPIFSESRFCAACHYGKFADTVIYNSYGEWLAAEFYSKKVIGPDSVQQTENPNYRSCQDCHMLSEEMINGTPIASRDACSSSSGTLHDFNHNMMKYEQDGSGTPKLIQGAASPAMQVSQAGETIEVKVTVTNERAGHKFPTDSPLRHLLLVVETRDELGNLLPQVGGDVIPIWGGVGRDVSGMDNYGGMAGKVYALLLADKDTGVYPTAAYWNPTKSVAADNRLFPKQPDESSYSFSTLSGGTNTVTVKLVYRYAFIELADQKEWNRPDVVVAQCVMDPDQSEIPVCR